MLPGVADLPGQTGCLLQRGSGARVAERPQRPRPCRHQVGQGVVGGGLGAGPDVRPGQGHRLFGRALEQLDLGEDAGREAEHGCFPQAGREGDRTVRRRPPPGQRPEPQRRDGVEGEVPG